MKDSFQTIIAMSISGLIFMSLSIKFQWSKKIWTILNKKIKWENNVSLWILIAPFFNLGFQLIFEAIGIPFLAIVNGITFGVYMGFMPDLGKRKQDSKKQNSKKRGRN